LIFHDRFSKNTQISNFVKILPLGAELFHADRRTDVTKLRADFRNFINAPKNMTKSLKKTSDGKYVSVNPSFHPFIHALLYLWNVSPLDKHLIKLTT